MYAPRVYVGLCSEDYVDVSSEWGLDEQGRKLFLFGDIFPTIGFYNSENLHHSGEPIELSKMTVPFMVLSLDEPIHIQSNVESPPSESCTLAILMPKSVR